MADAERWGMGGDWEERGSGQLCCKMGQKRTTKQHLGRGGAVPPTGSVTNHSRGAVAQHMLPCNTLRPKGRNLLHKYISRI
ncbi:hypothetical protein Q1695_005997 [Nippostrongylus brasiliensis]|nr:hypothetical protein Q1695_005997 [Nippostrongylus brasiliensis]